MVGEIISVSHPLTSMCLQRLVRTLEHALTCMHTHTGMYMHAHTYTCKRTCTRMYAQAYTHMHKINTRVLTSVYVLSMVSSYFSVRRFHILSHRPLALCSHSLLLPWSSLSGDPTQQSESLLKCWFPAPTLGILCMHIWI